MGKQELQKLVEGADVDRYGWERLIDAWIFDERDRKLLKRRLLDHIHFEPLAEEFDMSVPGVKKAVYKAQDRLFSKVFK